MQTRFLSKLFLRIIPGEKLFCDNKILLSSTPLQGEKI